MNREPWRRVARRRNFGVVPAMACLLLLSGGSLANSSRRAERSPGALGPHFVATNRLSDSTPSEYELMLAQVSGDFGRKTSRSSSSEAAAAMEEPEYRGAETIVLPLYIPEHAVPIRLARIPRSGSPGDGDDDEETGSAEDADAQRGRAPKRSEAVLLRRLGPVARPLIRRPPTPIRINTNRNRSPPTPPSGTRSRIPLAARLPPARRPDFVSFRPFLGRATSVNSPAPFNASRSFGERLAGSQAPSMWEGREEHTKEGDTTTPESPEVKRTKKNEFSKDSQFPEELHTTTLPPSSATLPSQTEDDNASTTPSTTKRPSPSRIISRKVIRKPVASKAAPSSSPDPLEEEVPTKDNPTTSKATSTTEENPDPTVSTTTSAPVITTFSPKETHSPRTTSQEPETVTTKTSTEIPNTAKIVPASSTTTIPTTPSTPATTSTTTTTTKKSQQGKRPSLIFPKPVSSILQSSGVETTTTTTPAPPASTTTSAADIKVLTTISTAAPTPTKGIGKGLTASLRNPPWLSRFRAREPAASHGPPPRKMPSVEEILNSESRKEHTDESAKEEDAPKAEEKEDEKEEEAKANRGPIRLRVRPQLPTIRFGNPPASTTTEPTTTTKQTTTTEATTTTTTTTKPTTTTFPTTLSTTTRSTEKEGNEEVKGEDNDEKEEEVQITTKRPSVHPPFSPHFFKPKTTPLPVSSTAKTTSSTPTAAATTTETTTTTKSPTVATRRPPITTRRSSVVVPRRPTTTTRKPPTTTRSTTPATTKATTTTATKPATTTTTESERKTRKPLTSVRTTTPVPAVSTTESRRAESITPFALRPKLRRVRPSVTSFASDEERVRSVVGGYFYPRRRRLPRPRTTTTTTSTSSTTTTTTTEAPTTPKAITITTTSTADPSRQTTFRTFLKFTPSLATKKATTPATTTTVDTTSSTTTTTTTSPTTIASSSSTLSPDQVVLLSLTEIMRDATHEDSDKLTNIRESLDKLNRELAGQDIHIIHAEVDGIEIRLDNETTPITTQLRTMTLRGPTPVPTNRPPTPTHFDNTTLGEDESMITILQEEDSAEEVVKRVHTSMKSSITVHKPEEEDENEVASSTVFAKELEEYATTSAGKITSLPAKSDLSSTSLAPSREEGVEFDGPTTPQVFRFAETPVVEFGHDERVQVYRTPTGSEDEGESQRKSEGVGMVISATSTSPSSVTTRTRSTTVPVTTHQEVVKPYTFSKTDAGAESSSHFPGGGGSEELESEAEDMSEEEVKEEATTVRGKLHPTSHLRPVTLPPPRTTADVETSPTTTSTTSTTTTTSTSTSSAIPTRTTTATTAPTTSTSRLPAIDVVSIQQEEESHSNDIMSGTFEGVVEEIELGAESTASASTNVVYVVGIIGLLPAAGAAAFLARKYLKKGQKALPESEERAEGFTPVTNHTRKPSNTNTLDLAAGAPVSSSVEARNPKYSPWEFPHAKLRLVSVLGEGNFGIVWKAEARELCACEGNAAPTVLVAVKGVKSGAGHKEKQDLLNELAIMQQLGQHANVVTLLGCCTQQEPYYVIMEYVMCGKLLTFLRDHRTRQNYFNFSSDTDALTSRDLTRFACHVANGCDYLQSRGIIHRDLAARNILVDHNKTCKIADFGLARNVKDLGSDIYEQKSRGALPIRWMAPESLYMNIFTHKSDVWSFGILCWEVVTLGSTPYPGMSAREVMRRVREGYRLDRPDHCRPELYRVVNRCWHQDLNKRPSFSELKHELVSLLDHQTGYIDLENFPESSYYSMLANNDEKL